MKHATEATLLTLAPLLAQLRTVPKITERKLGIFYRKSKAYLHFHEDPEGLFADVRLDGDGFTRFAVNTKTEQQQLFAMVSQNCVSNMQI
jgi:hypothetical protein